VKRVRERRSACGMREGGGRVRERRGWAGRAGAALHRNNVPYLVLAGCVREDSVHFPGQLLNRNSSQFQLSFRFFQSL
jgi:hypothetical protein